MFLCFFSCFLHIYHLACIHLLFVRLFHVTYYNTIEICTYLIYNAHIICTLLRKCKFINVFLRFCKQSDCTCYQLQAINAKNKKLKGDTTMNENTRKVEENVKDVELEIVELEDKIAPRDWNVYAIVYSTIK